MRGRVGSESDEKRMKRTQLSEWRERERRRKRGEERAKIAHPERPQ